MMDALRLADIRDAARKAVRECRATGRDVKVDVPNDLGRMWFVASPVGFGGRIYLSLLRDLVAAEPPLGEALVEIEGSEEALSCDMWQVRPERAGPSLAQLQRVFA